MPKTPRFPPSRSCRSVEVLAFEGVQLLDVAGPIQVFATANEEAMRASRPPPYRPLMIAGSGASGVTTSSGLVLAAQPLPGPTSPVDTLIVAGGPGVHAAAADPALVAWVRQRADAARRTASVCTGAFLLAETGLLDARRTATHWSSAAELARRYPRLLVEPDPIFVRDGPVWTSAGVTAGIDLALALVEDDLGRESALAVARYLVMFLKRPGGQAQFSVALATQSGSDRFAALHAWILDHLTADLSLPVLASRASMSERSFSRRYAEETGSTPARAVERLRIEAARRLLSEDRLPVKRVAARCGFGSEETMRRAFLRLLGVSPQEYRARFGG